MIFEQVTVDYIDTIITSAYTSTDEYAACYVGGGNSSRDCRSLASAYECSWNYNRYETCDWVPSGGPAEGSPSLFLSNMATYMCNESFTSNVNSSLYIALASALAGGGGGDYDDSDDGNDRVEGFCSWLSNIEALRGTRGDRVGTSRGQLNNKIFKDWYGSYDTYTETHRTKFTSYHFSEAVSDTYRQISF